MIQNMTQRHAKRLTKRDVTSRFMNIRSVAFMIIINQKYVLLMRIKNMYNNYNTRPLFINSRKLF